MLVLIVRGGGRKGEGQQETFRSARIKFRVTKWDRGKGRVEREKRDERQKGRSGERERGKGRGREREKRGSLETKVGKMRGIERDRAEKGRFRG